MRRVRYSTFRKKMKNDFNQRINNMTSSIKNTELHLVTGDEKDSRSVGHQPKIITVSIPYFV